MGVLRAPTPVSVLYRPESGP